MHRTTNALTACAAALVLATGCATTRSTHYTHSGADLGAIRTVAVLPFTTLTQQPNDARKVEKIFLVELLARGVVDVVEPGKVAQLVATERIASVETLAPEDLQRIGKALGADGLFLGSVVEFAENRSGTTPAPQLTIQLRLVETASGVTAWSSSETRNGANARARLFGFGGDSLTLAARRLIREQLRQLTK
jgi:TolB-like protein